MTITASIDKEYVEFYKATGRPPKFVFLGATEATQLDKELGQLVLSYKGMMVVQVFPQSCLVCGDKFVVEG